MPLGQAARCRQYYYQTVKITMIVEEVSVIKRQMKIIIPNNYNHLFGLHVFHGATEEQLQTFMFFGLLCLVRHVY